MNNKKEKQTYCWYGESFVRIEPSNQSQRPLTPKPNPEKSSNTFQFIEGWESEEAAEEKFEAVRG